MSGGKAVRKGKGMDEGLGEAMSKGMGNGMAGGGHSRIFANPANKAGNGFQPFHTPFSLLAVQPLPLALQLINSFFHGFSPII